MTDSPSAVSSIRWNAIFPWLILVRAARVALMGRVIALAIAGVLSMNAGWLLIDASPLGGPATQELQSLSYGAKRAAKPVASQQDLPQDFAIETNVPVPLGPLFEGWRWAGYPLVSLYNASGWRAWLGLGAAGLWSLATWGLFGGAIARIAAVYLTYGGAIGPVAALRGAVRKWPSTVGAPAMILIAIAILTLPMAIGGLLIRFDFMALLLGLIWFIALLAGALIAVIAIGLLIGWPLMWSTIAVERTDAFDAISREFAYVFQRPLHVLFYALVASSLGMLAQTAIDVFVNSTIAATEWAVSVGAGENRMDALGFYGGTEQNRLSSLGGLGAGAMVFWMSMLNGVAISFPMAYLWPSTTAIYLLLRREIDSTEMTEIVFDEGEPQRGAPALADDPATGVPQVAGAASTP